MPKLRPDAIEQLRRMNAEARAEHGPSAVLEVLDAALDDLEEARAVAAQFESNTAAIGFVDAFASLVGLPSDAKVENFVALTVDLPAGKPFRKAEITFYKDGATRTPSTIIDDLNAELERVRTLERSGIIALYQAAKARVVAIERTDLGAAVLRAEGAEAAMYKLDRELHAEMDGLEARIDALESGLEEALELADEANGEPSSCRYSVPIGDRIAELRALVEADWVIDKTESRILIDDPEPNLMVTPEEKIAELHAENESLTDTANRLNEDVNDLDRACEKLEDALAEALDAWEGEAYKKVDTERIAELRKLLTATKVAAIHARAAEPSAEGVTISVTSEAVGVPRESFGVPMILSTEPPTQVVTDLGVNPSREKLAAAGFPDDGSPEYGRALAAVGLARPDDIHPESAEGVTISIGESAPKPTREALIEDALREMVDAAAWLTAEWTRDRVFPTHKAKLAAAANRAAAWLALPRTEKIA